MQVVRIVNAIVLAIGLISASTVQAQYSFASTYDTPTTETESYGSPTATTAGSTDSYSSPPATTAGTTNSYGSPPATTAGSTDSYSSPPATTAGTTDSYGSPSGAATPSPATGGSTSGVPSGKTPATGGSTNGQPPLGSGSTDDVLAVDAGSSAPGSPANGTSVSEGGMPLTGSTSLPGGNAACGAPRVRKPWDSFTAKEQSLYIEALGLAIKNGIVKDLTAIHVETMGETQAHHSCGFFVWHRRILLAFEAYLRDMDTKYACVTIPYYDVYTAYVKAANKECTNMYDCSPIFTAIGGANISSTQTTLVFSGKTSKGYEHKGAPFNVDCDDDRKSCGAMLRNDLQKQNVPSGAGFGTLLDIMTRSQDYATFLQNIQYGIHNEVHNAVGGTMATFASPRDLLFYSWHSAIDMLLTVFHECHFGAAGLTDAELKTSLDAFTQATQSCGGVSGVGAESGIVMNVVVDGKTVDVSQHPTLGKYFSPVGDKMWNYGDTTLLGDYSYTYEVPAIIKTQVLSNKDVCKAAVATTVSTPSAASGSAANATAGDVPSSQAKATPHSGIVVANGSDASAYGGNSGSDEAANGGSYGTSTATTGTYWEWVQATYVGLVKRFNGDMTIVANQMRVIECIAFDNVFGVVEFDDDFVANFHLSSSKPVCGTQVDAVESGNITIAVEKPDEFTADEVKFETADVIEVVKKEAVSLPAVPGAQQIAMSYIKTAEASLKDGAAVVADKPQTETRSAASYADSPATTATTTSGDAPATGTKHKLCH